LSVRRHVTYAQRFRAIRVTAAVRPWILAKPIIVVAAFGLLFAPLAVLLFVRSGLYDVGASSPHTKFTEWLTHDTMVHSVRRHANSITAPAEFTPEQIEAGFCAYETHCVACHGAAGVARQEWVSGLEPAPPYLLDIDQRFTRPELFWIVKNGIKMTAMPSWRSEMSDAQIWSVVAWLEASEKLPPQTYVRWRAAGLCKPVSGLPSPGPLSIPRP
jgi:mono/diheme cytochrome c family protein